MPFVSGFLRLRGRRRPGGGPVDPDYGVDEGAGIDNELPGGPEYPSIDPPDPPPGIWPPLTPENPWRPVDPGWGVGGGLPEHPGQPLPRPPIGGGGAPDQGLPGEPGTPGHLPALPPGMIWPPLPPGVHGKYLALVVVFGMPGGARYRYTVVDADLRPGHPLPRPPLYPDQGLPGEEEQPTPEPHGRRG